MRPRRHSPKNLFEIRGFRGHNLGSLGNVAALMKARRDPCRRMAAKGFFT